MLALYASSIYPVSSAPIQNAAIVAQNNKIIDIGPSEKIEKKYKNKITKKIFLKDFCLMPAFINAHSHLELADIPFIPYKNFTQWISKVLEFRNSERKQKKEKIQSAIKQMLSSGIAFVADHCSEEECIKILNKSILEACAFLEVIGIHPNDAKKSFAHAQILKKKYPHQKSKIYLSAHGLHSLDWNILQRIFKKKKNIISIHLAESLEEKNYFLDKNTQLKKWIHEKFVNEKKPFYSKSTAIQELEKHNLLSKNVLAVHGNYFTDEDLKIIKKRKMTIVHCPSSRAYFKHQLPHLKKWLDQKIPIALGTDSLASSKTLSMLEQIKILRKYHPSLPEHEILNMLSIHAAQALQINHRLGSIAKNKDLTLVGIKLKNHQAQELSKEIVQKLLKSNQVDWMMIKGKIIHE